MAPQDNSTHEVIQDKIAFIVDLYKLMSEEKILLTYLGDITPEITNALLKAIKYDSGGFSGEVAVKKKVYKIIVECLENIYRYSNVLEKKLRPAIFLLGKQTDCYYIITGNYIYNSDVDALRNKLAMVNGMDKDSIKKIYRETIAKSISRKENEGSSLGIIDIALKSGQKLEYQFIPVEDNVSFYILKVLVNFG